MKKIMILPLVICLAGLSNAQPTDSPELLKKALTSYFTGIENKDFALMKAVTTDDFQLYEDGLVWNNDSAFMNIKRNLPFTVRYTMDHFKVFVDKASGYMSYTNHADFEFGNHQTLALDWIESATFRKVNGCWKMDLLHLTIRK